MAAQQNRRIEDAVTDMVNKFFDSDIRRIQAETHRCSAKCCEDMSLSAEAVFACNKQCSARLDGLNERMQQEMQDFQRRLERCVSNCQDSVRDKVGDDTSKIAKYQGEFDSCVAKCADEHILLLPNITKRLKEYLKKSS